jgi:hypothetical protein
MKINEFQERACSSKLGLAAKKRVGPEKINQLPGAENPKFHALIDDLGADLIAVSIAAEALGVTLEYVCETALQTISYLNPDDVEEFHAAEEKKNNDYN